MLLKHIQDKLDTVAYLDLPTSSAFWKSLAIFKISSKHRLEGVEGGGAGTGCVSMFFFRRTSFVAFYWSKPGLRNHPYRGHFDQADEV